VLTQQQVNVRILGQSRNVRIPVAATLFATGNNLSIAGDLSRRALLSNLDAGCERPEERSFETEVAEIARSHRGRLVVAALTVLRAWHLTTDRVELHPFGGFEDWSHRIRKPLVWLSEADPCMTLSQVRSGDPERDALEAVLTQWELHLGTQSGFTVQEVIAQAIKDQDFYTALRSVAESRSATGIVSNDRLGRWLKMNEGKIVNGLKLKKVGRSGGYPIWRLTR
jgi:putative DNA primase/helicase